MSGQKKKRRALPTLKTVEVEQKKIAAILERTRAVLTDEEHATLSSIVDTVALVQAELQGKDASLERLRRMIFGATTESTRNVLGGQLEEPPGAGSTDKAPAAPRPKPPGHGRNAAAAYTGAEQVRVTHPDLHGGEACPGCQSGKLYPQSEPAKLVRITGMAPLSATVYSCDRLRCNLCGEVFTAPAPAGVGTEKYDETATSMVGLVKYGVGLNFGSRIIPPQRSRSGFFADDTGSALGSSAE